MAAIWPPHSTEDRAQRGREGWRELCWGTERAVWAVRAVGEGAAMFEQCLICGGAQAMRERLPGDSWCSERLSAVEGRESLRGAEETQKWVLQGSTSEHV